MSHAMSNPETSVTVIEQTPTAVVEWNLDNWPTDQFNRLVPTQAIGIANEFIRPVVAVVQLDLETDTYSSRDLKDGHRAPNAKGLAKLADAAGVSFVNEERLDDGSDPMRAYVRVLARMIDPTGMPRQATGARDYVLTSQAMTDAQRQRAKGFVYEHASTRARHRALRLLLSLAQSYPVAELRKPFAVVRFLPNTQHPEVREIYKGALAANVGALFGPQQAIQQLGAGAPVTLTDDQLEDEPLEMPRQLTPGKPAAEPVQAAAEDDVPDWARAATPVEEAQTRPEPTFAERIQLASTDPDAPKGKATKPQTDMLARLFAPLGADAGKVAARGIRALFGDDAVKQLTAGQARAIGMAGDAMGDEFLAAWQELGS